MIVLAAVIIVLGLVAFVALAVWSARSERSIDYTPTHEPDERLRGSTRAASTATIGFITGSQ